MIEKKTLWAVNGDLEITEKVAIVEDGEVLMSKNANDDSATYSTGWNCTHYFDSEKSAKEWVANEERYIIDMVPKVKALIGRLEYRYDLRNRLGIRKEDYLGNYASDNSVGPKQSYYNECDYSGKLESFIRSRMLNIGGYMIPIGQVRQVQWYGVADADECEAGQWKAVLTTNGGEEIETASELDVRLVWATIGKASGSWFVDDNICYDEDDDK